jgi:hypothetical protein
MKIPESVDLENFPGSCPDVNTMTKTPPPEEPQRKHGRDTGWVFIEMTHRDKLEDQQVKNCYYEQQIKRELQGILICGCRWNE